MVERGTAGVMHGPLRGGREARGEGRRCVDSGMEEERPAGARIRAGILAMLFLTVVPLAVHGEEAALTSADRGHLKRLTPRIAREALALAARMDGWWTELDEIRKSLSRRKRSSRSDPEAGAIRDRLTPVVAAWARAVGEASADYRSATGATAAVLDRVSQALTGDATGPTLATRTGMTGIVDLVRSAIDRARALVPAARFLETFITTDMAGEGLSRDREQDGLRYRHRPIEPDAAPFSTGADLPVTLCFPGGLELPARGLAFELSSGATPRPRVSGIRSDDGAVAALEGTRLDPGDLGLPASGHVLVLHAPRLTGSGSGSPSPLLRLGFEVGICGAMAYLPANEVPGGRLLITSGAVVERPVVPAPPMRITRTPIPGSSLDLIEVSLTPSTAITGVIDITARIQPRADPAPALVVTLAGTGRLESPRIEVRGEISRRDGGVLGRYSGWLDRDGLAGTVRWLAGPCRSTGRDWTLRSGQPGLTAQGPLSLGPDGAHLMRMELPFTGRGRLAPVGAWIVAGADAARSSELGIDASMETIEAETLVMRSLAGPGEPRPVPVVLHLRTRAGKDAGVEVRMHVRGRALTFDLEHPGQLTGARLVARLLEDRAAGAQALDVTVPRSQERPDPGGASRDAGGTGIDPGTKAAPAPVPDRPGLRGLPGFLDDLDRLALERELPPPPAGIDPLSAPILDSRLRVTFERAAVVHQGRGVTVAFRLTAAGYTARSGPGPGGGDRFLAASDLAGGWLSLEAAGASDVTTVTLSFPDFRHGSVFPARKLSVWRLQQSLDRHFPGAMIRGWHLRDRVRVILANESDAPADVWVQSGGGGGGGDGPGDAGAAQDAGVAAAGAIHVQVPAHQVRVPIPGDGSLAGAGLPSGGLEASRIRLWAENEAGQLWIDHLDRDLHLVPADPALDGARVYPADTIRSVVYRLTPRPSGGVFNERLLELVNETPETLEVSLVYSSAWTGRRVWRRAGTLVLPPAALPPTGRASPRTPEGPRVRASRVQFTAVSENQRFEAFRDRPLWLVDESPAGRIYRAPAMGTFRYVFTVAGDPRDGDAPGQEASSGGASSRDATAPSLPGPVGAAPGKEAGDR